MLCKVWTVSGRCDSLGSKTSSDAGSPSTQTTCATVTGRYHTSSQITLQQHGTLPAQHQLLFVPARQKSSWRRAAKAKRHCLQAQILEILACLKTCEALGSHGDPHANARGLETDLERRRQPWPCPGRSFRGQSHLRRSKPGSKSENQINPKLRELQSIPLTL